MTAAGLYLHVPFCTSVCPYCDFAVTIAGPQRRASYLDAFDLEIGRATARGLRFDTVYLGGGTPSSLGPGPLGRIVGRVRERLDVASGAVWHLEVNPEDVSPVAAESWRDLGFDFASLGVQSFDDAELAFLGRRHGADGARRAARTLLDAGFPTVSLDLIFGLPGQTRDRWRRQLETALELGAQHLSCYQLTVHDGTVFGRRHRRGELDELAEDEQAELYLLAHEILGAAGWESYEVSSFAAAPHHRSRHNQKYWDHTPYLGLGPSAHSFDGRTRWWNRRKLRLWAAALEAGESPVEGEERLDDEALFAEAVMLGLRTAAGIDLGRLRDRFGAAVAVVDEPAVDRLVAGGWLVRDGDRLRPTPPGMAVADAVVRAVLA
ncbi:MAG: radical SAM family heme chaperone HemW [Thermoanaerobaculales bacterium]|jgi:oxygen-independent coproporphyrinogen-3 oxidase|nr:radical SAM family heme chaperone HemW [Thermoanaerobaculales bacterium]